MNEDKFKKDYDSSADGGGEKNEVSNSTSFWVYFGGFVLAVILLLLIFA